MIPLSILDLAPIRLGSDAAAAFRTMRAQARHAEKLGFHRYWIAEHHNMAGIGSAATSVLISHVAEATERMRGRLRGHHAAQPRPPGDRRAVRHPRVPLPRAHRPRPRQGSRAPTG